MDIRFDGRVAIVTGAGGGLGRAEAMGLAARGAKVLVNDYGGDSDTLTPVSQTAERVAEEIRQAGGEAMAHGADVSNQAQVEDMVARAVERWGRVDILINNAGILIDSSFGKMSMDIFRKVLDVHLIGSVLCSKAVWPHMTAKGYGRILMTTSSSGLYGSYRQANYGAAKAALVGLMNVLAIEGEKQGVRVNGLAPAAVTQMNAALLPDEVKPRLSVDAVTPAALFLVGDDAPTGVILSAVAGSFSRVLIRETEAVTLGPDAWTPEAVAGAFETLMDAPAVVAHEGSFPQLLHFVARAQG